MRQKKKKSDFPSSTPRQLFFYSLNFFVLCQLLGKWEGKEKKISECKNHKHGVLVLPTPESAMRSLKKMLSVIMCEANSEAPCGR